MPPGGALAAIAVVFGAAHTQNTSGNLARAVYVVSATFAGLAFGGACYATGGGLLAPMLAHFVHNALGAILALPDVADAAARVAARASRTGELGAVA